MGRPKRELPPFALLLAATSLSFTLYIFYLLSYRSTTATISLPSPLSFLQPIAQVLPPSFDARPVAARLQDKREQGWSAPLRKRLLKRAAILSSKDAGAAPKSIPITDPLPSTLDFSSADPLLQTWDDAFNSLSTLATTLSAVTLKSVKLQGKLQGVPGTGIAEEAEAKALQEHLDCMSGRGEWVRDERGVEREKSGGTGLTVHKQEGVYASCEKRFYKGREATTGAEVGDDGEWDVRESLKWRWVPSSSCAATAPPGVSSSSASNLSRRRFCTLLAHKSTLIVGDSPQYSLHDLLLDWTSMVPQSCYGDLYCREHSLCGDVLRTAQEGRGDGAGVEDWEEDERVFNRLPRPPSAVTASTGHTHEERAEPHHHAEDAPPTKRQLNKQRSPSYGTLLRYRRTDGLRPSTAQTLPTYTHPSTGIREVNQQWMADSRRSDLVILSKPPLPLPLVGHNSTWDEHFALRDGQSADQQATRMIEAAWRITEEVWLPEMMETLRAVRGPPSPVDQLVVYRGGWRSHHDCAASSLGEAEGEGWPTSAGDGPPPHRRQPSLSALLFRSGGKGRRLIDPHTLFFNLQTVMQNYILRTVVLPQWGIPFLDLESSLSVWRSGMVGSSAAAPFNSGLVDQSTATAGVGELGYGAGLGVGLRSAASGDCSRYCMPSPGGAIEEAFIGGLLRIFERGWASTQERRKQWVGDDFENLRERTAR